ncbi:MAG: hypothetical protein FJ144_22970 [Deltaproteobacteria bacterium]|nr:hypothetical protein [Deltaproteobacteria bacterium]
MTALASDEQRLAESLRTSPRLWSILGRLATVELPAWYLGAGCIAQTHWNVADGKPPDADILDWDVAYFEEDTSAAREEARIGEGPPRARAARRPRRRHARRSTLSCRRSA